MLSRIPVPESAARKIQTMILTGELKSGEKVPSQREFSQMLKVSRASLREALLTLETLGLLKTEPGRGTFISHERPSAGRDMAPWRYAETYSVHDVFETRLMIEGQIAALAAQTLAEQQLQRLERATDAMERFWEAGDLLANVEADVEFHGVIVSHCGNRLLVDLYQSIRDKLTETQRQPIPKTEPARMSESIAEHRALIKALRARDAGKARAAMERHIANTARCAGVMIG